MLAERSELHLQLFREDQEAVFFGSKEELLKKVTYYLKAKEERKKIALNGYKRCLTSQYDHHSRMVEVLNAINEL